MSHLLPIRHIRKNHQKEFQSVIMNQLIKSLGQEIIVVLLKNSPSLL